MPSWSEIAEIALVRFEWFVLFYYVCANSFYGLQLAAAAWDTWAHTVKVAEESRRGVLSSALAPSISMLVPAHNEAVTIGDSVLSLLTLHYRSLEIVVVNDGSQDDTLEVLKETFDLAPIHPIYRKVLSTKPVRGLFLSRTHPNLIVVDKVQGGKADAQNVGLMMASGELVCVIDADTLIEPDALQRMVRPFLARDDVLAGGGTIRLANGSDVKWGRVITPMVPRHALAGFQVVEYLRAFLFGRVGWNRLGGNLIISGAFGLFRREAVIEAGGYASDAIGEDMELIFRLRRVGYENGASARVEFIPDPVAWTEAPETLRALAGQRNRWHRGLADALWRHRQVILNPRYGAMGMVVVPYFFFVELLAPVIEAIGLLGLVVGLILGVVNVPFVILFFAVAYGYSLVLTGLTLALEDLSFRRYSRPGDRVRLWLWTLLEPLGYRQLTVIWRLRGLVDFLRRKQHWGAMPRRGFGTQARVGGAS